MAHRASPPVEYRFRKGQKPKSNGRPKDSRNKRTKMRTPALDELVKFPVGKGLRRMSRREAIMRYARDRALSLNDFRLTSLLLEADRKLRQAAYVPKGSRPLMMRKWIMSSTIGVVERQFQRMRG